MLFNPVGELISNLVEVHHEDQGPVQHDGWKTVPSQDNRQSEADQVAYAEVSNLKDGWG